MGFQGESRRGQILKKLDLRLEFLKSFVLYWRTHGRTDMARSTHLLMLIKNTFWGRKSFLLSVTYILG